MVEPLRALRGYMHYCTQSSRTCNHRNGRGLPGVVARSLSAQTLCLLARNSACLCATVFAMWTPPLRRNDCWSGRPFVRYCVTVRPDQLEFVPIAKVLDNFCPSSLLVGKNRNRFPTAMPWEPVRPPPVSAGLSAVSQRSYRECQAALLLRLGPGSKVALIKKCKNSQCSQSKRHLFRTRNFSLNSLPLHQFCGAG